MSYGNLVLSAGLLLMIGQQSLPTSTAPLRNTFVVAAETVIDNAAAIDVAAEDVVFNGQFQQFKSTKENLAGMAEDDREKSVLALANDLQFQIAACHLQARNGASASPCKALIGKAQQRMMESIRRHKTGDVWVDGPPA